VANINTVLTTASKKIIRSARLLIPSKNSVFFKASMLFADSACYVAVNEE
jgi:hypothetical protein